MTPNTPRLRWKTPNQRKADMASQRTNTVAVRLDDDEHARWKTAAAIAGRKQIGQWVRETVDASLDGAQSQAEGITGVLRAQGQALNKIARELERIRTAGVFTEADAKRVEAAVIEAKQLQPERNQSGLRPIDEAGAERE